MSFSDEYIHVHMNCNSKNLIPSALTGCVVEKKEAMLLENSVLGQDTQLNVFVANDRKKSFFQSLLSHNFVPGCLMTKNDQSVLFPGIRRTIKLE